MITAVCLFGVETYSKYTLSSQTFFCQLDVNVTIARVSSFASSSASLTPIQARNNTLGTRHVVLGGATLYLCQSATVKLILRRRTIDYIQAVLIHACKHDILHRNSWNQFLTTMIICSQMVLVEATAGNTIKYHCRKCATIS